MLKNLKKCYLYDQIMIYCHFFQQNEIYRLFPAFFLLPASRAGPVKYEAGAGLGRPAAGAQD